MTSRARQPVRLEVLAALACLALSDPAYGYCLSRSCDPDGLDGGHCRVDPETGCSIEGVELRRPSGCITIAIRKGTADSVPGLTDAELEQIVLEGFEMWTSLDCGGGHPAIRVQSAGIVETAGAFACNELPDQNVDLWLVSDDVSPTQVVTPTSGTIAGVTSPSFLLESGTVFDADVTINTLWALVQDEEDLHDHLRVVAAHEAGHLLGLAHSQDENALMYRNYVIAADRAPTSDDREAICELFPPAELDCDEPDVPAAALNQRACSRAFQQRPQPIVEGPSEAEAAGCAACSTMPRGGQSQTILAMLLACVAYVRSRSRSRG